MSLTSLLPLPSLIAIIGPKGCGKSTLASLISSNLGYTPLKFSNSLKLMLKAYLASQGVDQDTADRMLDGDLKETPTQLFENHSPRHAMQTLGTEWRDLIGRDLWLNAWERSLEAMKRDYGRNMRFIVDDLRFIHEAEKIRQHRGIIISIHRQGFGPGPHASEREYLKILPDLVIANQEDNKKAMHRQFSNSLKIRWGLIHE